VVGWAGALFLATLALGSAGCKAKVGGKCQTGQFACDGANSGLYCASDNKFASMSCLGAKGCVAQGKSIYCDNDVAQLGDGCAEENDVSCTTDKKSALQCAANKFGVIQTCKGANGCQTKDGKLTCDNDISDENDPCHFDNDFACTSDAKLLLKCVDKKMIGWNSCRGAKGCRVMELPQEKKVNFWCDESVAEPNDPCDTDDEHACSTSKKALLHCKNHKYQQQLACNGPKGCTVDEKAKQLSCDEGHTAAPAGSAHHAGGAAPGGHPHH
jgi:hypothetical protein